MSGGVVGSIGMTGAAVGSAVSSAVTGAAAGAAVVIGATAMAALDITRMGSIAAYEQMKLAAACTAAVNNAKRARMQSIEAYRDQSRKVLDHVQKAMNADILRLHTKLEQGGHPVNLRELGSCESDILLKLIEMDQAFAGGARLLQLRIPSDIYRSVTELIDPLFAYIPEKDPAFQTLTFLKNKAAAIVSDGAMTATEKSEALIEIQTRLIVQMDAFKACSRKYEYYLAQFNSLLFANQKLAEACGQKVAAPVYNPYDAQAQIDLLAKGNAKLRKKLRAEMRQNQAFLAANKELGRLVFQSIRDAGYEMQGVLEQDFGTSAMFAYRDSLLRTTVSKQGMLSMDLVGRTGESAEHLKEDEAFFCKKDLQKIYQAFEKNGLAMNADRICSLTEDSMLYEDDVAISSYQDDRRYELNPQVLYATPAGKGS